MENIIIIAVLAVILAIAGRSTYKRFKGGGCCSGGSVVIEEKAKLQNPVVERKTIHIEGMHCDNCRNRVIRDLQRMQGVACTVNLKKKTASVEMDHHVENEELKRVIEQAGYQVVGIE